MNENLIKQSISVILGLIDGAIADKTLANEIGLSKEIDDVILALQVSKKCLQSELDRQENKPLSLEQLKDMLGEPVWVKDGPEVDCYVILYVIDDTIHMDGGYYYSIHDDVSFLRYEPNGGE